MDFDYSRVAQDWADKARKDFEQGRDNQELEHYDTAAFLFQQAVEKALKAVLIEKGMGLRRTHNCRQLARETGAPTDIIADAAALSEFYVSSRYPDENGGVTEAEIRDARQRASRVLTWTEQHRNSED
mgnify:CR=1 FL=1